MLKEIRLEELTPSPTNPRKTFDQPKLEELSRSIAEKGLIQPIVVRPHQNGGPATYEIVAGERRFRAAGLAKVETVPCIVRELSDVEVLELQTIENLQRDDLHPLEEAEGYAALMKQAGYDVEQIAQKISRSGKYVYDRIKLLQLIPAARKIFLDGEISAGHAILLARLNSAVQKRAIGDDDDLGGGFGRLNGLFQMDQGEEERGLELDDEVRRKPVSVRELEKWINDNVRFRPDEVDLPNLFPETAAVLAAAEEEELKVVKITRDYRVPDHARDEKERTYGSESWKRADGEVDHDDYTSNGKPSKKCDHSVLGVVVAGRGRGEAFRVCIAKKKCAVHWKEEQKAANERHAPNGAGTAAGRTSARDSEETRQKSWEEKRRQEEAERARWTKAAPKLLEALAKKLEVTPAMDLVDVVIEECASYGAPKSKHMKRGDTVESAVRFAAFLVLGQTIGDSWNAARDVPKALKEFGIDAKKIVDEVAPKPKPEKKKEPKKAAPTKAKKASGKKVQTSAAHA